MTAATPTREILTPEQAADYLQVNRETIYRYIKDGRLIASKLGRTYRIPRQSVEQLLLATRTSSDIPLRRYSAEEIEEFFKEDELSDEQRAAAERIIGVAADRLPEPGGSVVEQLAAAGLLAPKPPLDEELTDDELRALEAEHEAWLDTLTEPLNLAEAILADREGR